MNPVQTIPGPTPAFNTLTAGLGPTATSLPGGARTQGDGITTAWHLRRTDPALSPQRRADPVPPEPRAAQPPGDPDAAGNGFYGVMEQLMDRLDAMIASLLGQPKPDDGPGTAVPTEPPIAPAPAERKALQTLST